MNMNDTKEIENLLRKLEELQSTPSTFLTPDDIAVLTGRKSKSRQIEALRQMGVPFFVNGTGHPIVARTAVEGGPAGKAAPPPKKWSPKVLNSG
ncbi:DUF4224 domain-containing protein [Duganella margarita]|nr:DUF4224 domain-containing protein [Duganella margarita]